MAGRGRRRRHHVRRARCTHCLGRPAQARMLVVDEAHYVKNPNAQRSQAVTGSRRDTDRVLFLTGTPMENRVEEFRSLVAHLRPELAAGIGPSTRRRVEAFRRAAAPVYLRRNQEDVLTELPALVQVDEWEEFGAEDGAAYREAVAPATSWPCAGRRSPFAGRDSAKLTRLRELAREATANGRKVVVFSYFRDVLDAVGAALGNDARGPVTGSTPAAERQRIVDEFTASPASGAGVPDPGRRRRAEHPGRVGGHPLRAAGQAVDRGPGGRPRAPDGTGPHRPGAPPADRRSVDQRMLEILARKRSSSTRTHGAAPSRRPRRTPWTSPKYSWPADRGAGAAATGRPAGTAAPPGHHHNVRPAQPPTAG